MSDNILDSLNDSQRAAVEYCDGASLVIAGAGSGKTRVLTHKIAYLLDRGMMPWNILALTFTNKAANEMKARVAALVGGDRAWRLNMGTFHSVFARILRAEAGALGYNSNFTIYDQGDSRSLIKSIIKEMGLDAKIYPHTAVADRISMAKNRLLQPQAYAASAVTVREDTEHRRPQLKDIYMRYAERCRQANAMDFDDLLMNTYVLFANHEDIRLKYVDRFKYVLVDEYQDTNFAQQSIVTQLTKDHRRICAVGDDAQSIYGFRGANIDNILNFTQSYDGAKLFKLERNYRSTQAIVMAANSLISHNARQIPKETYSENEHGDKLVLKPAYSDKEEAQIVCNDIKRLKRADGCEYSDFAILYRTNSQSRSFEECMRKMNIPYRIYGGLSFYQRKEIKDVIAYFRVVVNPDDEEALRRIINYPSRGIGATTLNKIIDAANNGGESLWRVIGNPTVCGLNVSAGTQKKLDAFRLAVEGWAARAVTDDAYTLGHDIIKESGIYKDIYGSHEPEDMARQENIDEFLGAMSDFVENRRNDGNENHVGLGDYLQEVALLTDLDSDETDQPKVALMTIHSAKGLEFPTVFVVGLEENIFPSPMCVNSMRELEEERRLLYVAVTRAEKRCILTCAKNRFRFGRMEFDEPSRFIRDFDPRLIRVEQSYRSMADDDCTPRERTLPFEKPWQPQYRMPKPEPVEPVRPAAPVGMKPLRKVVASPQALPSASSSGLAEGMVIEHQRFGRGRVVAVEGSGENTKATVNFDKVGTKQLLLKFARYTVVG